MFLNIAKMPLKNFKFMAAFCNLFNKSALSVTYRPYRALRSTA